MVFVEYTSYYKNKENDQERRRLRNKEFILIHTLIPLIVAIYCVAYILEYI